MNRTDSGAAAQLKVRITHDQLRRLDEEASRLMVNRSAYLRMVLEQAWGKQQEQP